MSRSKGFSDLPVKIACGQCSGCRLERSRQWAVRCVHESHLYEDNCFVTLTYDDAHLPDDESLSVRPLQLFMKRLRKANHGKKIRFFACGEYGSRFGRPHFHVCLFNHHFSDRRMFRKTEHGDTLCDSDELTELWSVDGEPLGFASVGELTWNSAAYVARYIMDKKNGPMADTWYEHVTRYGEVVERKPEFVVMSRRPGIGKAWYDKYGKEVFRGDFVVMNGKKFRPPRYYDKCYEVEYPSDVERLKRKRVRSARKHKDNNTPERLRVRERVHNARVKRLERDLR